MSSVCDNKESMIYLERIELNPKVCNGVPVIKGTRIPVAVILEQLAEGELWEKVLTNYPELIREDIQAVLLYAKSSLEHIELEEVYA